MLTVKEVIGKHPGAKTVEVYEYTGRKSIHTDNIMLVDCTESDAVERYELMDGEEYESTVLANSSITWNDIEESFPALVIIRRRKENE